MAIGIIGVVIAFSLIIFLNYIDVSIYIAAVLAAIAVILFNGMPFFATFTGTFFPAVGYYFGLFIGLYMFGAVLGNLYAVSGAGASVALTLMGWFTNEKTTGPKRDRTAVIITIIAGGILNYGGINSVVLVFMLYPIGLVLFEKCDIPRKYLMGTMMGGTTAFLMCAPGSPHAPNIAAMTLFGTGSFQGLIPGFCGSAVELIVCTIILTRLIKKAKDRGEHFSYGEKDNPYVDDRSRPSFFWAVLPLIVTYLLFNVAKIEVSFAIAIGCLVAMVAFRPYMSGKEKSFKTMMSHLTDGANSGCLAMGGVAAAYGFGTTMNSTAGFTTIVKFFTGLDIPAVMLLIVGVAILAAMTGGSGSSQLLAVPMLLPTLQAKGLSGAFMHRISAFAGSTFDSLPSSGAVLAGVRLTGIPMKECYPSIFVTTVIATWCGTIVVALVSTLFPMLV